uniref:Transmembrane protein n=1 Tax=Heterorhabditis bacteriophora TaxID=37862 RepID=A0A1I7WWC7_HETBA
MAGFKSINQTKMSSYRSRVAIVLLLIVNYGNSVILTLEAFGSESHLTFLIILFNSFVVICTLYGIYSYKLVFITPNVISKVSLSSAALFYGLQMAETSDYSSVFHLLWILLSVCLFIWEIHAMFSATFGIIKELNHKANLKPPPSYNQKENVLIDSRGTIE